MGGNVYAQITASCLAESGRESLSGDIYVKNNQNQNQNQDQNQNQALKNSGKQLGLLGSLLIFAATLTGFGAPLGIALGTAFGLRASISVGARLRSMHKKMVYVKGYKHFMQIQQEIAQMQQESAQNELTSIVSMINLLQNPGEDLDIYDTIQYAYRQQVDLLFHAKFKAMVDQKQMPTQQMILEFIKLFPEQCWRFTDPILAIMHYGNDIGLDKYKKNN